MRKPRHAAALVERLRDSVLPAAPAWLEGLSVIGNRAAASWTAWARRLGRFLAGARGDRMVVLAGQAIRGVAMEVVIMALLQTVLARIGLLVAGVIENFVRPVLIKRGADLRLSLISSGVIGGGRSRHLGR